MILYIILLIFLNIVLMKNLYFLWYELNWLEFITYVLIPNSIILVILVYIYFNISLIKISFDFDLSFLTILDKNYENKFRLIKKKLKKYR